MKRILFLATFLMLASTVSGQTAGELQAAKDSFNANNEELPSFIGSIVGNQKINLYLENESSETTYRLDMKGTRIDTLERGEWENPSLEVWADIDTVKKILGSEKPFTELREQLDSGNIRYEEKNTVNTVKFFFADMLLF